MKNISTPDFSTPSFNPGPFNPRFFNHGVGNSSLKSLWLKFHLSRRSKDISNPDFSTPDFSTVNFSTPRFKKSWLKSSWLKSLGMKPGVDKSRVEMSFNSNFCLLNYCKNKNGSAWKNLIPTLQKISFVWWYLISIFLETLQPELDMCYTIYDISHHVNGHTYWLTFKAACSSMYFCKVQIKSKVNSMKKLFFRIFPIISISQ